MLYCWHSCELHFKYAEHHLCLSVQVTGALTLSCHVPEVPQPHLRWGSWLVARLAQQHLCHSPHLQDKREMEQTGFAKWENDMPKVAAFFSRSPQILAGPWDHCQSVHRPLPASGLCCMRCFNMGSHERDTLEGRAEEISRTNLLSTVWNLTSLSAFCKYFLSWKLLQPDPSARRRVKEL